MGMLDNFNPYGWVKELISPVVKLIDDVHTSDEEEGELRNKAALIRNKLVELQNVISSKMIDLQSQIVKGQTDIILAETKGQSWLQRNWRPLLMLVIVVIIANNYILFPGLSIFTNKVKVLVLPDKLWNLMMVGVGGYIGGRTVEKGIDRWKK
jgi:hypothetical protein